MRLESSSVIDHTLLLVKGLHDTRMITGQQSENLCRTEPQKGKTSMDDGALQNITFVYLKIVKRKRRRRYEKENNDQEHKYPA